MGRGTKALRNQTGGSGRLAPDNAVPRGLQYVVCGYNVTTRSTAVPLRSATTLAILTLLAIGNVCRTQSSKLRFISVQSVPVNGIPTKDTLIRMAIVGSKRPAAERKVQHGALEIPFFSGSPRKGSQFSKVGGQLSNPSNLVIK